MLTWTNEELILQGNVNIFLLNVIMMTNYYKNEFEQYQLYHDPFHIINTQCGSLIVLSAIFSIDTFNNELESSSLACKVGSISTLLTVDLLVNDVMSHLVQISLTS